MIGCRQPKSEKWDSQGCVFYYRNFKEIFMIKHSAMYHLLTVSHLRLLEFILNYAAGNDVIILLRWERDGVTTPLLDVLMPYLCEIEFCYRGREIRHLIWNLQQSHSSFCNNVNKWTTNLFIFRKLVPRVSWFSDREEGTFLHIKKPTCPRNEVAYLVTA